MSDDQAHAIERLLSVIEARKGADPGSSYTASLLDKGPARIAQKLGEEAVEAAIAAVDAEAKPGALVGESADILYHLLVLWTAKGVSAEEVWAELDRRAGTSGLEEKASRQEGR
ncbi:MAG: phosphoribosyl-ATP diphosphatase [Pseudomonadota bacterium]